MGEEDRNKCKLLLGFWLLCWMRGLREFIYIIISYLIFLKKDYVWVKDSSILRIKNYDEFNLGYLKFKKKI